MENLFAFLHKPRIMGRMTKTLNQSVLNSKASGTAPLPQVSSSTNVDKGQSRFYIYGIEMSAERARKILYNRKKTKAVILAGGSILERKVK